MCVCVRESTCIHLLVCMDIVYIQMTKGAEEGFGALGAEVTGSLSCVRWLLKTALSPLKEQQCSELLCHLFQLLF